MRKQTLLMTVVGLAILLVTTGAMGQPQQGEQGGKDKPRGRSVKRQRVLINGKEDKDLSRRAVKRGSAVMVPSDRLFQVLGGAVKRQRGWVPPGSRQPDRDRSVDWYVAQLDGRELRYQPDQQLYYYDGAPQQFATAPYEREGSLYLALAEIMRLFGGTYNYEDNYDDQNYYDDNYDDNYGGNYDGRYYDNYYDQGGQQPYGSGMGTWVFINGQADPELSRNAVRVRDQVMVPARWLFQRMGSDVRQERWVRPDDRQYDFDRDRRDQWYVSQHDGRELRYRADERIYYYGGRPRYWTIAPHDSRGTLYVCFSDLAKTFGGGYQYDARYGQARVTLRDWDSGWGSGKLRLVYPHPDSYSSARNQVVLQGYAPPYAPVRARVTQATSFLLFSTTRTVYNGTMRANRNGLFSVPIWLREEGEYKAKVELLDDYGRVLDSQTTRFYVR
jgi:hypothetical protein